MAFVVDVPFKGHSEYLEERGIDAFTRERLRIVSCGPTALKEYGFKYPEQWNPQSALLIPANKITGEASGYGARLFYQKTFGSEDSRAKYLSLPGDGKKPPSLHFSPLARWDKLEYGQRIFICESYIKANIVCKLGFHAIGVSGVNGWSFQRDLHRDIADIDWRGQGLRPVAFMDSNVNEERADLWLSIKKLQASMQSTCGTDLEYLALPGPDTDGDWGLDDYCMANGEEALRLILGAEAEAVPSEVDAHLIQMNQEVCYVHEVGKFMDMKRYILMGRSQFEDAAFSTRKAFAPNDTKPIPVAKAWTRWDHRNEVDTLKYKPGQERVVREEEKDCAQSYFNLWRGWGCEPIEADCSLFTDWMEDAFSVDAEREYFLDWWSYQLQFPGVKLNTAMMLVGPSGVGKGWMAHIMGRIFGHRNTWKCNLSDLESRFNSGLGASQVCIIEEADIAGGVKVYNTLKDLITNEHIRYERKGVDAIQIDNCLNIYMNSNHIDVLHLDEFDRRFAVLEITTESFANDPEYWDPRWEWTNGGSGDSAVFGYLLGRQIIASFDPKGEAPWSAAKSDMIESTHHPVDKWVYEYVKMGEEIVVGQSVVDGVLMSAKELAWCYNEGRIPLGDIDRKETMLMVKALNNSRVQVANNGKKIKYLGLPTKYYWVGKAGSEDYYQDQLESRLFWKRLVASQQNKVASEKVDGYPKY